MLAVGATTVGVEIADERVRRVFAAAFAGLHSPGSPEHRATIGGPVEGTYTLAIDDGTTYRGTDPANVIDHLVAWCNRTAVVSRSAEVNVHAAAVTAPDQAGCTVLPAPPGGGKSSVAAAACSAGFGYLSDEVVSIDSDGLVRGYPKPLTLKAGSLPLIEADYEPYTLSDRQTRWYLPPASLGGHQVSSAPAEAIVFVRYTPEHETACTDLGVAETLLELATNCQDDLDDEGRALEALGQLAARCRRRRLGQRDLAEAVRALEAVARADPPDPSPVRRLGPAAGTGSPVGPAATPGTVGVVCSDGVVLHHPPTATLVVLDALAGVIWQLLDGTVAEPQLAHELAEAFEHPVEDVARDVAALLEQLRDHDLVYG